MSKSKTTFILALCILIVIEAGFFVWEYILRPSANLCDNPYGITIHCKDEDLLQECLVEMDKLPKHLLLQFKRDGWSLFVGDGYLKDVRMQFSDDRIMGMTRTVCKEVLVSGADEIAHEFGHYLYTALNEPSAFRAVYEENAPEADMPSYYRTNEQEYFAQSFAFFINGVDAFDGSGETKAYFEALQKKGWTTV